MRVAGKSEWIHVAHTDVLTHYGYDARCGKLATVAISILPLFRFRSHHHDSLAGCAATLTPAIGLLRLRCESTNFHELVPRKPWEFACLTTTPPEEVVAHRLNPVMNAAAVRRWNAFGAVCLWCLLFGFCSVPASLAQYRFDSWTADDGLPQNIIRAIHQTPDGYLWLVTADGLVRFDGVRFTVFDKANSLGINSNRFTCLYEDAEGALWAGTENGGVTRYHDGRFTTYSTEHGLPSNWIRGISGDEAGNLWVLANDRIALWANGQFLPAAPHPFLPNLLKGFNVIRRDDRGGFWAVNDVSLSRWVNGRLTTWTRRDGLPSLSISNVVEDQHGTLWVATLDAGLVRIENDRVVKVYSPRNNLPGNWVWLSSDPQMKIFSRDERGAVWITDPDSWKHHLMTNQPPDGLLLPNRYEFYEDREGNLWIGTEGGGLYRAPAEHHGLLATARVGRAQRLSDLRRSRRFYLDRDGRSDTIQRRQIHHLQLWQQFAPRFVRGNRRRPRRTFMVRHLRRLAGLRRRALHYRQRSPRFYSQPPRGSCDSSGSRRSVLVRG